MALLDGGLAGVFGAAFGSVYLDAVLHRPGAAVDDGTGSITTGAGTDYPCKAQLDSATQAMRQSEGFVETDQRVLVLAASLAVTPDTNDEITFALRRSKIASVAQDPAASYWDMRVRQGRIGLLLSGDASGAGGIAGTLSTEARLMGTSSLTSIVATSGLIVAAALVGSSAGTGALAGTITNFSPALLFAGGFTGAWYDPSDLSSMFQNSNGTTAAAVDSPVGYIADKSGNGKHAIQATAAARPILRRDGTTGKLYLEFDGTDDFLGVGYVQTAYPLTFMACGRSIAAVNGGFISVAQSDTQYKTLRTIGTTLADAHDRNGSDLDTADATISAVGDQVLTAEFNTSLFSVQVNNGTAITAANTNAFGTSASLFIGKQRPSNLFSGCRFYGGIVINKLLSASEKAAAKTNLGSKAGLTV